MRIGAPRNTYFFVENFLLKYFNATCERWNFRCVWKYSAFQLSMHMVYKREKNGIMGYKSIPISFCKFTLS